MNISKFAPLRVMKADRGGSMGSAHSYLGIRWKRMITSTPQPLYPGERFPGVGPRAGLDVLKKREIPLFFPLPGIHPRSLCRPTRNLVTMLNELPQLLRKEQEVMHLPVENVYTNRLLSAV
jgi:hypothetical protein